MLTFNESLAPIRNNKPEVTIFAYPIKKLSLIQLQQLASAMAQNTHVRQLTGYSVPDPKSPEALSIEIINQCLIRNRAIHYKNKATFRNYLTVSMRYTLIPPFILSRTGEAIFSNTIGLNLLHFLLSKIKIGKFTLNIPTLGLFELNVPKELYLTRGPFQSVPSLIAFGSGRNKYKSNVFSALLIPINYIARHLGKILGISCALPLLPLTLSITLSSAILKFFKMQYQENAVINEVERYLASEVPKCQPTGGWNTLKLQESIGTQPQLAEEPNDTLLNHKGYPLKTQDEGASKFLLDINHQELAEPVEHQLSSKTMSVV